MNKKRIAFGMGIALVVLAVLTAPALGYGSEAWLDPENSTGEYGEADVLVYFNFTESVGETVSGQDDIFYDKNCVEIVTIDQSMSAFSWNTHNWFNDSYHPDDWTWYNYKDLSPTHTCVRIQWDQPEGPISPGSYTYAVLTLHCKCSSGCGSDLIHGYNEMNNEMGDFITGGFIFYNGTYMCTTGGVGVDNVTTTDINVSGTVSGNHTLTHTSNDVSENITEEVVKGKSYLEHKWTIDVISGTKANVAFYVEAWHTANNENDHFEFAYSTSLDGTYTPMVTVTKTSDTHEYQTATLPNETSGIVYIRVMDTDRRGGKKKPDTIFIDHMFIRSVPGPKMPNLVITNKSETLAGDGTFTVTYTVTNIGDGDAGVSTTSITTTAEDSVTDSVPALPAGQSYTNTVSGFNCPCGTIVTVTVCADDGNAIVESNEDNNCLSNELTCPPCGLPDLNITDIWCQEVRKNTYDIYYNITNSGTEEAGKSVSNWTVDSDEGTDRIASLGPGDTSTEKFTYRSTTAPPYTIKVCADYNKKIEESDEANNCMEVTDVTCPKP